MDVDHSLPTYWKRLQVPCFARSSVKGEFWPCILEKAWAKLHGNYCLVRKGSPTIALGALTFGQPYKTLEHAGFNAQSLCKKVMKAIGKGQRVVVCQWDNEYSGRDLDPLNRSPKFYQTSSPVWLVGDCDEQGVSLIALSEKEKDIPSTEPQQNDNSRQVVQIIEGHNEQECETRTERLTWEDYRNQYMLTIKQYIQRQYHEQPDATCRVDFNEESPRASAEGKLLEKHLRFFSIRVGVTTDNTWIYVTQQCAQASKMFKYRSIQDGAYFPARFTYILMSSDGQRLIETNSGQKFENWLKNGKDLQKGKDYILAINAHWFTDDDPYRQIILKVLTKEPSVVLRPMPIDQGLSTLKVLLDNLNNINALKNVSTSELACQQTRVVRSVCFRPIADTNFGFVMTKNMGVEGIDYQGTIEVKK